MASTFIPMILCDGNLFLLFHTLGSLAMVHAYCIGLHPCDVSLGTDMLCSQGIVPFKVMLYVAIEGL